MRFLLFALFLIPALSQAQVIRVRMLKGIPHPTVRSVNTEEVLVNGQLMPSHVKIKSRSKKTVDVILTLPLEVYLMGVVPHEMPLGWPIEALKAQAVAARSFAYRKIKNRRSFDYDVDADVFDQKYVYVSNVDPKIASVIAQTRDMVLLDSKNRVLQAFYHADCGGKMESANNVWGEPAHAEGSGDSASIHEDCPHPSRHWEVEFPRRGLVDRFVNHFGLPKKTSLRTLQTISRSSSGRVRDVRLSMDDGGVKQMTSQEFRRVLGFNRLPSANFKMSWLGQSLRLTGTGRGHGVGLCQLGAKEFASQGKTFREILNFYYPNSRINQKQIVSQN